MKRSVGVCQVASLENMATWRFGSELFFSPQKCPDLNITYIRLLACCLSGSVTPVLRVFFVRHHLQFFASELEGVIYKERLDKQVAFSVESVPARRSDRSIQNYERQR